MGAKVGQDGQQRAASSGESLSEQIGDMAEASREEARQGQTGQEAKEPVRRADGTVLEPRGDKPKNPKKKMFEADVEDAKYAESRQRDEL